MHSQKAGSSLFYQSQNPGMPDAPSLTKKIRLVLRKTAAAKEGQQRVFTAVRLTCHNGLIEKCWRLRGLLCVICCCQVQWLPCRPNAASVRISNSQEAETRSHTCCIWYHGSRPPGPLHDRHLQSSWHLRTIYWSHLVGMKYCRHTCQHQHPWST